MCNFVHGIFRTPTVSILHKRNTYHSEWKYHAQPSHAVLSSLIPNWGLILCAAPRWSAPKTIGLFDGGNLPTVCRGLSSKPPLAPTSARNIVGFVCVGSAQRFLGWLGKSRVNRVANMEHRRHTDNATTYLFSSLSMVSQADLIHLVGARRAPTNHSCD